jgi:hypothetical protein
VPTRRYSIEHSLFTLEHSHQFTINVSVHVLTALSFGEGKFQRHFVAGDVCCSTAASTAPVRTSQAEPAGVTAVTRRAGNSSDERSAGPNDRAVSYS